MIQALQRFAAILAGLLATLGAPAGARAALPDRASVPLRSAAPDLTLTGEIGSQDKLTYRDASFQAPEGVVRLTVEFDYTGRDQHTVIDLGVSDPDGFRGWSGSNKASFTLSPTDATPSYLPGAIKAGTWKLNLSVSAIRPDVRSRYTARIWFWRHGDIPAVSTFSAVPIKTGARWYRGDLHMHTAHSDGACTTLSGGQAPCPLYRTVEAAVTHGLDFIAISDHNAGSQFDAMRELQPAFDTLLLIPAVEVTTFQGHANVLGTTEHVDPRLGGATVPDAVAILDQVRALHALISVNHPTSPTDETCRGCGWSASGTDWSKVDAVEALNSGEIWGALGGARVTRPGAAFWRDLLNQGHRLTGVGGSDNHDVEMGRLGVGLPTTVVYAPALSERAVLDAIHAGHVFIDTRGTRDGVLELNAEGPLGRAMMGDTLAAPTGSTVKLTIHVAHAKGGMIMLEEDGQAIALPAPDVADDDTTRSLDLPADGKRHWVRADVRIGALPVLIGNPVYLNWTH